MNAIILISDQGLNLARKIQAEIDDATIYSKLHLSGCEVITDMNELMTGFFGDGDKHADGIIFIGAMGICVRTIAPHIRDKHEDPAVVCVDTTGKFAIPVLSGHVGGANVLALTIAGITGGEPVITTLSDNTGLWALDTIGTQYGWTLAKTKRTIMNRNIALFVGKRPTALITDVRDEGTEYMLKTLPEHVKTFKSMGEYRFYCRKNSTKFDLLIIVSPMAYPKQEIPVIQYHPRCLHLGVGCQKMASVAIAEKMLSDIRTAGYAPEAIASIGTIDIKKDEPMIHKLQSLLPKTTLSIFTAEQLNKVKIPNPSDRVFEATGCYGVAEASAIILQKTGRLVVEKQKDRIQTEDGKIAHYTWALGMTTK